MGKLRGKLTQRHHNVAEVSPTGLVSVQQAEKERELTAADIAGIETVIEKLKSLDANEREYGCDALGAYISNPTTLREVLSKNIVRIVSPLLHDVKPSVQLASSRLLREMSEEGGFEACELMIRQEAFTGLGSSLRNRITEWKQCVGEVKTDGRVHGFINSIYTVQNLCECSALAVRMCIEDSIPEVLLACLEAGRFSPNVLLAAAQCLYTISEENETVADLLRLAASQLTLSTLISNDKVLLYTRVILAGVQFNIYGLDLVRVDPSGVILSLLVLALQADSYEKMIKAITTRLQNDHSPAASTQDQPAVNRTETALEEAMDDVGIADSKTTKHDLDKEMESLDHLLSAQKLSFEIITNIISSDDADDWTEMNADDDGDSCGTSDSNELMDDDEMDISCENPVATRLVEKGLMKALSERLKFVASDVYHSVGNSDKIHRQAMQSVVHRYDSMLVSCLLCLNNTMSQLKLEKSGDIQTLQFTLKRIFEALSVPQVSSQEDLVESITSALSSTTKQLISKSQAVPFGDLEMNTLQHLITVSHTATAVNAVRCFAAVGTSLSKHPTPNPIIRTIGSVLVQVATSSKELWLVAEALDSLMDVFAEDSNNIYLKELGLISTLQIILPQLKTMVTKRDKSDDTFLPVLTVVKSNLPRFIKYKTKVLK